MNYDTIFFPLKENFSDINIPPIHIIYFTFLTEPRWKTIVYGQCQDIISSAIPARISFVLCSHPDRSDLLKECSEWITDTFKEYPYKIDITTQDHNQYEYPGLKKLYDTASTATDDTLFLYLHSKGMVYHSHSGRNPIEVRLTKDLLYNWKDYLNIFDTKPSITMACMLPQRLAWYNFFWIRGSYMKTIRPPRIDSNRFYYEAYLHEESVFLHEEYQHDCYSMHYHDTRLVDIHTASQFPCGF
jgi:hypothetical protein